MFPALEIKRTFWEKATILHATFNRPAAKSLRDRYARHYSGFAALWRHGHRDACLSRLDLLERVAKHKHRYFGSPWTSYDTAKPGPLRLSPFASVLEAIAEAEQRINALYPPQPKPLNCKHEKRRSIERLI